MKKLMYFAAALLVLVGCNKNSQTNKENAPQEVVTIKGSIELPQTPNKIAAPTDWESATEEFYMLWQAEDKIYIYNTTECEQFTIASGAGDNLASFNGNPLSSMESYNVAYGYDPQSTSTDYTVPYIVDNYLPFAEGLGTTEGFEINTFGPVVGLQLKGEDVTLSKIEIILYGGDHDNILGTFTMPFEGGLALNNTTATKVYFPLKNEPAEKMKIRFYENISSVETLIMSKTVSGTNMPEVNMVNKYSELVVVPFVPTYVDLGLPSGLKWATCNVGATTPEGYGDYFAWGETEPYYNTPIADPITWKEGKKGYYWKYYCGNETHLIEWSTAPYDATTKILKPEFDAAHVNWGGNWRMPTKAEIEELLSNCDKLWTTEGGVSGYKFTSKTNDNYIFLPASGYFDGSDLYNVGSLGRYWSSSLYEDDSQYAYDFYFDSGDVDRGKDHRFDGRSVRPVCK